jgi:hypothetical protein
MFVPSYRNPNFSNKKPRYNQKLVGRGIHY